MDKNLILEELKAQADEIAEKIEALENEISEDEEEIIDIEIEDLDVEEDDEISTETEDGFNWKKAAGVAGVVAAVGTGAYLIVKKPWQVAKVVHHIVHLV